MNVLENGKMERKLDGYDLLIYLSTLICVQYYD